MKTFSHFFSHETKRQALLRFLLVFLVVIAYFVFVSLKYGVGHGLGVTALTWSFFVFCTPIADAGFLLDFPIRLLLNIRMFFTEMLVWIISFGVLVYSFLFNQEIFHTTFILKLYYQIVTHPFPFWIIILVSMGGTFLSVYFGDELMDTVHHKQRKKYIKHTHKHHFLIFTFLILFIIALYYLLLKEFNLQFI